MPETIEPKGYCTPEEVARLLQVPLNEDNTEDINKAIATAELIIEGETGRVFIPYTAEKVYSGTGKRTLIIDDIQSMTSITITEDGTDTVYEADALTAEFILYPTDSEKKYGVSLKDTSDRMAFPQGVGNVKINGSWGYSPEVPYDITSVCITLSAGIFKASERVHGGATISSERIGNYAVTYDTSIAADTIFMTTAILKRYKKPTYV